LPVMIQKSESSSLSKAERDLYDPLSLIFMAVKVYG
jgi:hypothetical protein